MPKHKTHYKAAKASSLCDHEHKTMDEAGACTELGDGPGVVVCSGPGAVLKRIVAKPGSDDDAIVLG